MRSHLKVLKRIPIVVAVLVASAVSMLVMAAARPAIVDAARNNDREALRALLQKGANVNESEPDGTTALHWTSYRDDVQTAEILLKAGANVNAANDLGATPLWLASQNGSAAMTRRLLEAGANPNLALLSGETPLMVASRTGSPAVVEMLLAKGADVNARGSRKQTALMWAVAQKHPDVVKVLLAHKADIHARSATWTDVEAVPPHGYLPYNMAIPHGNDTALMFASLVGDLASAKLLVAAGANVNDTDAWGVSATAMAAHSNFTELVEFLLEKGANASAGEAGFSAIHPAIMHRSTRMVRALLEHGADPNAVLKTWTPTRRTSKDYNFPPEHVGSTPFWLAARFTQPEVMQLLIKHGADPKFVFNVEYVPDASTTELTWAPRKVVTTTLMAALGMGGGAEWVPVDRSQKEALTLEAVRIAVEGGADINLAAADGRTALDAARSLKFDSVVKFLESKGAKPGTAPQRGGGRGRGNAPN
jgi:ankyrin repeat protein